MNWSDLASTVAKAAPLLGQIGTITGGAVGIMSAAVGLTIGRAFESPDTHF
ncbi:hypothetical protein [Paraburkholderia dioscoreae]|uniref:Uncharacterized protein n=1 Tax=Paraburkholderia dioscoreae TaxID=2604047 RepID=A0A5Q4Z282_9BURK|nr:hypothetical protein [Paraburkholderia dioscoreae]VVD29140.1 conserved protein of unknown function [Paraburkholderia dioscoreae]